jgi:hypothetical protein
MLNCMWHAQRLQNKLAYPCVSSKEYYGKQDKHTSAMCNYSGRQKKLLASKSQKTESLLLEWFRQQQTYIPIQGQEGLINSLKTKHWIHTFERMAWSIQKTYRAQLQNHEWECKIDKEVGAWKVGILPSLLSEYHPKDIVNANECGFFQPTPRQNMCF